MFLLSGATCLLLLRPTPGVFVLSKAMWNNSRFISTPEMNLSISALSYQLAGHLSWAPSLLSPRLCSLYLFITSEDNFSCSVKFIRLFRTYLPNAFKCTSLILTVHLLQENFWFHPYFLYSEPHQDVWENASAGLVLKFSRSQPSTSFSQQGALPQTWPLLVRFFSSVQPMNPPLPLCLCY